MASPAKNILFVSSEAYPLVKTGGLGDVAGSLPLALRELGQDVRLLMPAYASLGGLLDDALTVSRHRHYDCSIELLETRVPDTDLPVWLVDCEAAFGRYGNPYVDGFGQPWADNARRFALLAQVAVDVALDRCGLDWKPDLVHCNDWQTGLVPALLDQFSRRPATLFTIHNMAYQGVFPRQTFIDLGLQRHLWGLHGLEFYDQLSYIKGGLVFADRINTVSPSYAREIQREEFGYGLHGLLRSRADRLSGIINGIDTQVWNPQTDDALVARYSAQSLDDKLANKTALQEQRGLPVSPRTPVLGMISRLVEQKGLNSVLGALDAILQMDVQLVLLGSGEHHYEQSLRWFANRYPQRMSLQLGYDERLAHQIEAGSDIFLMPSRFEPCGLNQLYSLAYGTLPLVRPVGGLADTVVDFSAEALAEGRANGFWMMRDDADALLGAIQRALDCYARPEVWRSLQRNAMAVDYSWGESAKQYLDLYRQILRERSPTGSTEPLR